MRKFSKSKKAAILATVMGGWLIGGSALASNNLFITVPSNYGNSNLSVITGSRVTSQVDKQAIIGAVDNLNRDPGTYAFVMDGKNMFVMRQYTYSTTDLLPFRVIDADADWSNLQYASGTVSQGANPHSAAGANGYVYTGDYDLGTITVSKLSKDSLTEEVEKTVYLLKDINDYCGGNLITGLEEKNAWVHGEGININGDNLYIMVSVNPIGGYTPYDDSYLMHYKILPDGSLKFTSYTRAVRNNDTIKLNRYNNQLMGTGIGGYQSYDSANPETGITIASIGTNGYLNPSSSKKVILPESVINDGLEFHDMNIWPDGTAYIMAYSLTGSGSNSQLKIYKTTVANLNSDNPEEWETVVADNPDATGTSGVPSGWINRFFTEYYTKRLWGEIGNYLVVYTDGDKKPALVWDSYGLAGNDSYHTFNSTSLLEGDSVYGDQAVLTSAREEGLTSPSVTTKKITNLNANLKTGDYTQRITGTDKDVLYNSVTTDNSNYIFDTDKVIDLRSNSWATQTDLKNNILAAVYAKEGNDINIDAGNNTLQLQTSNIIATPVGVYAGNGKNVTINAGKLNVITVGVEGGNSLTNAIMNDGGLDKANKITINGDVNINMRGGWGGNGVAVQKTSRWGEASYASNVENSITINGNLSIKGADNEKWGIPLNSDNVLSRFNNAGILTQVNNSRVDVTGLVDMDVYGNGITANAVNSTISIGGGTITVPKGMNYSYYTLGAYQGTINVNTGKDGKEAGTNDVKLNGDVFALNTGKINLALTTADSYLQGMVDNGGTVNMWLQNGASWYNQENNTRYEQDNEDIGSKDKSHINKFIGGSKGSEGVIYQKLNSKDIVIDNYSGNAIVIYEHDSSTPTSIYGGNITVGSASAGSGIILRTDSSGIDLTSAEKTDKVLDSLANKLYYTNYTVGEKNLDGEVQIAEGLTASSVSKRVGSVAYDETTGQGRLDKAESKPDIPKPDIPNGDNTNDGENISVNGEKWIGNNSGDNVSVTVNNNGEWQGDNSGNKLTVTGKNSVWNGSNNGSNMQLNGDNFTWNGDNNGTAATVKMKNGSTWTGSNTANDLNAVFDNSNWNGENKGENATVELKNDSSWEKDSNGSGLKLTIDDSSYKGNVNGSNSIVNIVNDGNWTGDSKGINNKVDIETGTWTGDNNGDGAVISLGGTAVKSRTLGKAVWNGSNNAANSTVTLSNNSVWNGDNTGDKASITINGSTWNGSNEAVDADINLSNGSSWSKDNSGKNAEISLTESEWTGNSSGEGLKLTADKSEWTGNALAEGNAELKNGAVWKGSSSTDKFNLTLKESTWKNTGESKLGSLSANNGIVDMTESGSGNVTIGKYSGSTTVIYSHEEKDPTKVNGGNFTIGSAESGSKITLQTDNKGVDTTDEDSINEALNALANKLYYTGYVTGEKNLSGYVKIAEGLTAASVQKQVGDIKYDSATGQGSLKEGSVTPGVTYPEAQTKVTFTSQITGDWSQDKEYKLAGVLHTDNAVYNFQKDSTTITVDEVAVGADRYLQLQINNKDLTLNSGADAVKASGIDININDVRNLNIKADGKTLLAENGGRIIINNSGLVTANSAVKAEGTGSVVEVKGLADINTSGGTAIEAADGSVKIGGGTINGDIYASGQGSVKINTSGSESGNNATKLNGDITASNDADISLGLSGKDSSFNGNVISEDKAVVNIYAKDKASWTGKADGDGINLTLLDSAKWNNTGDSKLNSLSADKGIIDQTGESAGNITVDNYSGSVTVLYKHSLTENTDGSISDIQFHGGNFTVKQAEQGSSITLRTDRSGINSFAETENVEKLFNEMAKKLFYLDAENKPDNLVGRLELSEGLTATSATKVYGDIEYSADGQGSYKEDSLIRTDPDITYGSSETAMMRGAKSAMASTALLWRSENNDMLQRIGDVRLNSEESGLWAKYYGGKTSYDANNTKYSTSFNAYQLGYDKKLNDNVLFGTAVSYNKGSNTYEMGGHGDSKNIALSVYSSWNGNKGHYADVVVKGGKLNNDYKVYNDMGHKLEGDYDTWGVALSAEYGRRMQLSSGFWFDPSVQFTLGRINGTDYSAESDFLDSKGKNKYMYVSQDAFTSAIGRIGLGIGKTAEKGMFYTKLALAHEFSGDFTTTFAADGEPTSGTRVDFSGSWLEWQLGGNMKLNDNSYVYATFEKKFGGDTGSSDWRLDAGLRWSF